MCTCAKVKEVGVFTGSELLGLEVSRREHQTRPQTVELSGSAELSDSQRKFHFEYVTNLHPHVSQKVPTLVTDVLTVAFRVKIIQPCNHVYFNFSF